MPSSHRLRSLAALTWASLVSNNMPGNCFSSVYFYVPDCKVILNFTTIFFMDLLFTIKKWAEFTFEL
jgi:hypothetical protein